MKVLLLSSPFKQSKYLKVLQLTAPPLGLAYIASVLEMEGHSVEILDLSVTPMDREEIKRRILTTYPEIIGITTKTPTIYNDLRLAKLCKESLPESIVVLGGYHATFCYEDILKNYPFVDVIVRGEGEITMRELLECIESGRSFHRVKGLTFRDSQSNIVRTEDRPCIQNLDELPFPARHLLPMDRYRIFGKRVPASSMICSRGCPMQCSFCASAALHGKRVRFRSPRNVVEEIKFVKKQYSVKNIAFIDDTFTMYPRWVDQLCELLMNENLGITWGCTTRVDRISKPLMQKMWNSGCRVFFVGVESGDQVILNEVKKGTTIEQTKNFFDWAKDVGIITIASLAFGFLGETKKTIMKSIEFVKRLDPSYAVFSLATPYPGTKFYGKMLDQGLIKTGDWSKYTLMDPVVQSLELTLNELRTWQKEAYRQFYLRPLYILRITKQEGIAFLNAIARIFSRI